MVRPRKVGLDYFPMDVDMDQDDKIYLVKADHGWEGFAIVVKLFMDIYKEGYYIEWDERKAKIFSRKNLFNLEIVNAVINLCLEEDLFDKNLFDRYGIVTSNGIQKRYLEATTRRKIVEIYSEYLLVDIKDTTNNNLSVVNVYINPSSTEENDSKSTQSIVEHSKEENSREIVENKEPPTTTNINSKNNPVHFYQENFGMITAHVSSDMLSWIDDLGDELVLEALVRSVERNKKNWGYVKSILRSWLTKGIKTIEQAKAEEVEFQNQKNNNQPFYQKKQSAEVVPDWFSNGDHEKKRPEKQEVSTEMTEEQKKVQELMRRYAAE